LIKKLLNSKFRKDLSFSYIAQAITVSFGFIQLFLINRYFGVETYGQLAIIMSTAGIFSALLTARSSEAITRFFTREMLNNNLQNAKFILFVGFCIDIITAFLMIGFTYLLSEFVAQTFMKDIEFSSEVFLYSFVIFLGFLRGTIFGYFQSKEMFFLINTITIFESFVKIIALFLIIFVFSNSTLEYVIWTLIVASFLSFFYALIVFLKHYIQEFGTTHLFFNKVILKEYWSFNIKTFASSSLKAGNSNIDNLLIAYFLNAQTVGLYQIVKKILSPIGMVVGPFSMLVYPKLVHFFEKKEVDKFKNLIFKISSYIFFFAIFYILIGYVFIEEIFALMNIKITSELYALYRLLSVLVLVTSMLWWTRVFSNVVNPNYSLYMNIFATIFQLTITVLATYLFGVNGLITSMIVMNLIVGLYNYLKLKKENYNG
jgi:O-antigen/teichoic acid export membrane protein